MQIMNAYFYNVENILINDFNYVSGQKYLTFFVIFRIKVNFKAYIKIQNQLRLRLLRTPLKAHTPANIALHTKITRFKLRIKKVPT